MSHVCGRLANEAAKALQDLRKAMEKELEEAKKKLNKEKEESSQKLKEQYKKEEEEEEEKLKLEHEAVMNTLRQKAKEVYQTLTNILCSYYLITACRETDLPVHVYHSVAPRLLHLSNNHRAILWFFIKHYTKCRIRATYVNPRASDFNVFTCPESSCTGPR